MEDAANVDQATLCAFFNTLLRTERATRSDLEAYQRGQLAQLLKHAFDNSLFYHERLAPLFRGDGSLDWGKWPEIPLLTRNDVRENGLLMHCVTAPERHGPNVVTATSGTSGRPLQFTMTNLTRLARQAALYRTHTWHDLDWSGSHGLTVTTKDDAVKWPEGAEGDSWGPPWRVPPAPPALVISANTSMPNLLEWLERKKVNYFTSQAIIHDALADENQKERRILPLKAMLSYGMSVEPRYRSNIREALGVPIIELYGSEESGAIAHQCPESDSLHIMAELVLVEILDTDNRPCRPGETGRVILTVLHNAAQPLIRYDQGDLATPGPPCRCGRSLPVIAKVEGRVRNLFKLPNGTVFSPSLPSTAFIELLHSRWWQVAQIDANTVEVRFYPQRIVSMENYSRFSKIIADIWSKDFAVKFSARDEMPEMGLRKHVDYVNETLPPA